MRSRLTILVACVALPLALWGALPVISSGQSGSASTLQSRIDEARRSLQAKRDRERVLSGDIAGYTRRINSLQRDITTLQAREARLQGDLDRKRRVLARIQADLRAERARLARLRARLAQARTVLAARLLELYKSERPDIVTVILQADGFADLLERGEFLSRVSQQDKRIIDRVKAARLDAIATARRLDRLEERQQRVTAEVLRRRDAVAEVRSRLDERRDGYASTRSSRQKLLVATRASRSEIEDHLRSLEREQQRIAARLRQPSTFVGPVKRGTGRFIWPVNGPVTSGFGQRWGRLHAGIDISAPGGTPIRAADTGTVALAGWTGGYGNYTCIQHGGGIATCYGHQSGYATSAGANVRQGQVIGYVGNTGHSFGNHLHFEVRINGTPVDPMGYL